MKKLLNIIIITLVTCIGCSEPINVHEQDTSVPKIPDTSIPNMHTYDTVLVWPTIEFSGISGDSISGGFYVDSVKFYGGDSLLGNRFLHYTNSEKYDKYDRYHIRAKKFDTLKADLYLADAIYYYEIIEKYHPDSLPTNFYPIATDSLISSGQRTIGTETVEVFKRAVTKITIRNYKVSFIFYVSPTLINTNSKMIQNWTEITWALKLQYYEYQNKKTGEWDKKFDGNMSIEQIDTIALFNRIEYLNSGWKAILQSKTSIADLKNDTQFIYPSFVKDTTGTVSALHNEINHEQNKMLETVFILPYFNGGWGFGANVLFDSINFVGDTLFGDKLSRYPYQDNLPKQDNCYCFKSKTFDTLAADYYITTGSQYVDKVFIIQYKGSSYFNVNPALVYVENDNGIVVRNDTISWPLGGGPINPIDTLTVLTRNEFEKSKWFNYFYFKKE